ncbi:hypothetical protein EAS61_12335 [Bradyrhizobium zhanjiangense]|uniref:Uncharacterized protein n=1 Tax=Bradyrhizobium zhanjiangense TaxID=1325107 RepID=A0A4Q0QRE4_9BRAD|nr:hypothetical protein [Bradyrhizobium zhanjiangense]RXG99462.1 hypothetical protein EAS61_12335 [Bradyrhizobium zhanjiangense]
MDRIMPIRSMIIAETGCSSSGFVQRLLYNALASGLARGRIAIRMNNRTVTLHEAERLVRNAHQIGRINEPDAPWAIRIGEN